MTRGMEKRKFYRLPYPLDVVLEIVTAAEMPRGLPLLHLQGRNISKEGICLEAKTLEWNGVSLLAGAPCERENRLSMTITFTPQEPALKATGEVRWYDIVREADTCLYLLGVEFLEIRNDGRNQLLQFLKSRHPRGIIQKLFG